MQQFRCLWISSVHKAGLLCSPLARHSRSEDGVQLVLLIVDATHAPVERNLILICTAIELLIGFLHPIVNGSLRAVDSQIIKIKDYI